MLTCPACQFANPPDHKFCQRCGEPLLAAPVSQPLQTSVGRSLQTNLMPADKIGLSPATYIEESIEAAIKEGAEKGAEEITQETTQSSHPAASPRKKRYQVTTVLNQGSALITDTTPEVLEPLQAQLLELTEASLSTLQSTAELPAAAYPYLLLSDAAPVLYDAWQQNETTVLITQLEQPELSSLIQSFSTAVDPLQHVYWLYRLTDLWAALESLPQWRSSLLLADNIGIDSEQSVRIRQFVSPASEPPSLADLKAFLQSLLAQPHRGAIAPLRQIRQIILAVSSSNTLEQLRSDLAAIGESLLETPAAMTPAFSAPGIEALNPTPIEDTPSPALILLNQPAEENVLLEDFNASDMHIEDIDEDIDFPEPSDNDESTMALPMKLNAIESAGRTDVGRQRDHNEDCFLIASNTHKQADNKGQTTQTHSLYVLCDGMGGHAGGEIASQLAAETLSAYFAEHWPDPIPGAPPAPLPTEEIVTEAVQLSNQAIYDINEKEDRAGHERMGTTLVLVLVQGTEAVVAHVGDSRLYQYTRRTGLKQITTDHEVGQREIQRGVPETIAYARPDAYQLTQALGPRGSTDLMPSVSYLSFSEDVLLLLCSDGLSDNNLVEDYLDSHIDPILRGKKDIETGVDELIALGNEVNGHDNISAIAIRLKVSPNLGEMQGTTAPRPQQTIIQ